MDSTSTCSARTGNAYAQVAIVPNPGTGSFPVVGAKVALSDDGNVVAFTYGQGSSAYFPTPSNVYVWDLRTPNMPAQVISRTAAGVRAAGTRTTRRSPVTAAWSRSTRSPPTWRSGPAGESIVRRRVRPADLHDARRRQRRQRARHHGRDGRHIAYNLDVGEIGDVMRRRPHRRNRPPRPQSISCRTRSRVRRLRRSGRRRAR